MAYFAPTAPAHILQKLADYGHLGSYHLLLAHDVVRSDRAKEYEAVFAGHTKDGRVRHFNTVIMDNSAAELGGAVDLDMVEAACMITKANVAVLPDILMDGPATTKRILEEHQEWHKRLYLKRNGWSRTQLMVIPQGKTYEEWLTCAEALKDLPGTSWWGLGKNFNEKLGRSRAEGVAILRILNPHRKIHLMGFSDNFVDDVCTARLWCVEGIDSAVPIRIANQGVNLSLAMQVPKRGDWWETATFEWEMIKNLKTVREWIRNEDRSPV